MADSAAFELFAKWKSNPPPSPRFDDVTRMLENEHRAYSIPLYSISADDYANDEEVNETRISALYTITHIDELRRIYSSQDRDLHPADPDWIEDYWRALFDDPDSESLAYRLLLTQHGLGQRTSVVLEREGETAVGFKVYGHSTLLIEELSLLIGFPPARTEDGEILPFDEGSLENDRFVNYLQALHDGGSL